MTWTPSRFWRHLAARASLRYFRRRRQRSAGRIARAFTAADSGPRWLGLTEWLARDPANPEIMMLVGPRWNCHAVIGVTDFIQVDHSLTIQSAQASDSARFWTVVIYDARFRTVAHVGNTDPERVMNSGLVTIDLPPGKYLLGLRYYDTRPVATFPGVRVDDQLGIASRPVGAEAERYDWFLHGLRDGGTATHTLMHYHAYAMLRSAIEDDGEEARRRAREVYLPVGNPETAFAYGAAPAGSTIRVTPPSASRGLSYLSVYDRGSHPLYWTRVDDPVELRVDEPATYLVRHVSADGGRIPADLRVEVERRDPR